MALTFEQFMKLSSAEVDNFYPEPGQLSEETLSDMASSLGMMDEPHLVAAIQILGHHRPVLLLPVISRFLSDRRVSIWSAAERVLLNRMPKDAGSPQQMHELVSIVKSRRAELGEMHLVEELLRPWEAHLRNC